MRELGQHCHDVELTHDRLRHQVDLTTPATPKLNYQMAQTWEHHQLRQQKHQVQQRAHQLERREAAMLQLVLPMVRRLRRQWERATFALVVTGVCRDHGQECDRGCEPHRGHITDRWHLAPLTRLRAHRRQQTGPASTSPRHYELSAADGTTFA